jgi:hypothetical protein
MYMFVVLLVAWSTGIVSVGGVMGREIEGYRVIVFNT